MEQLKKIIQLQVLFKDIHPFSVGLTMLNSGSFLNN